MVTVIMGCGQSTPGNDKTHLRVLLWLRHARGQLLIANRCSVIRDLSEPKLYLIFSKRTIFSVVALNEDSNGDINKNTENGGTKVIAELSTSNGIKRISENI